MVNSCHTKWVNYRVCLEVMKPMKKCKVKLGKEDPEHQGWRQFSSLHRLDRQGFGGGSI